MLTPLRPPFASAKSVASTPLTLSLKVTVKLMALALVGLAPSLIETTVGGVASQVTVLSLDVDAVLLLPARSVTLVAAMLAVTVPDVVMLLMATRNVVPSFGAISVTVAVFVPPAVPPIVMSVLSKVEVLIASLKTAVKLIGSLLVGSA